MNVSDFDFREAATSEFMNHGLGAKLTDNSQAIMRGLSEGTFPEADRWAISFACGSIIERVLWQASGIWMGYFNFVPPVTGSEKEFLGEYAGLLKELEMPAQFQQLSYQLGHLDSATDVSFYRETLPFIPLGRKMPEWFPAFQASLITYELLNEPAITSFFLFLRQGDVEQFKKQMPNPNAVFSHLQDRDFTAPFHADPERPEPVIAGFIRYTEFLSAMDGIFPDIATQSFAKSDQPVPNRIVDRDILFSVLGQYRWRFPRNSFERLHAVLFAFGELAASEFAKYPAMGIQWSFAETYGSILHLSQKFFAEFSEEDFQGEEDPRVIDERQRRRRAIDLRIQALRGDRAMGASASAS
jgi:hypothetical protein